MYSDYYIYMYVDPKNKTEPFYIGKGRKGRYLDVSQKQRNKYLYNKIQKLRREGFLMRDITVFPFSELTNSDALQKEKELIYRYGRKDQNRGPLLNYTDGGDGVSGILPNPILLKHKDTVIKLYNSGKTAREIANIFKLKTTVSVFYILKMFEVPRRKQGKRKPNIDIAIISKEYQQTPSVYSLAKKYGCDHSFLKKSLIEYGIRIIDGRSLGNNRKKKS